MTGVINVAVAHINNESRCFINRIIENKNQCNLTDAK